MRKVLLLTALASLARAEEIGVDRKAEFLGGAAVVRALAGQVFRRVMIGLWLVVFLPLGLFLALQWLIVIARPAAGSEPVQK